MPLLIVEYLGQAYFSQPRCQEQSTIDAQRKRHVLCAYPWSRWRRTREVLSDWKALQCKVDNNQRIWKFLQLSTVRKLPANRCHPVLQGPECKGEETFPGSNLASTWKFENLIEISAETFGDMLNTCHWEAIKSTNNNGELTYNYYSPWKYTKT